MKLPRPKRSLSAYVLSIVGRILPARLLLSLNRGQ